MPRPVLDSVIAHLRLESEIGGYEAAEQARQAIEHVYDAAARLIGCRPDEIAVIEKRDPRLGHGLLFHNLSAWRHNTNVRGRVREQLHSLPPNCASEPAR